MMPSETINPVHQSLVLNCHQCSPPFLPFPSLSPFTTTLGFLLSIYLPLLFHPNHLSPFPQKHENSSSEINGSELKDDKLAEDLVKLEGDQSDDLKKDWFAALHEQTVKVDTDVAKIEEVVVSDEKRNMNFLEVSAC
ncbi:hypothetical protein ACSQ67_024415 [Phaseolus vulgaris]